MRLWGSLVTVTTIALLSCSLADSAQAADSLPLKLVADIRLSGNTSRFDYLSIDPVAHRLFITHMGAGTVVVFDLTARREISDLQRFPGATGIIFVPSLDCVFVSITGHWWNSAVGGGEIATLDAEALKTLCL